MNQAQREGDALGFPREIRVGGGQGGGDFFAQGLNRGGNWVHHGRLTGFSARNNPGCSARRFVSRSDTGPALPRPARLTCAEPLLPVSSC